MDAVFRPPTYQEGAFNCPHCMAYSNQRWSGIWHSAYDQMSHLSGDWSIALCDGCGKPSMWLEQKIVYPPSKTTPPPNGDMPPDIRQDYDEAADILERSPRGAAALLRLAIQKLCVHLALPGHKLDDDIAELVKGGLQPVIQQALDAVRVIGNNAVHPGQMDLSDNPGVARSLFAMVNIIVEQLISVPKQTKAIFDSLPAGARAAIAKRDGT